ncbi:MAG: polysaccharide biosynthesis protein [Rhodobacteraceae bacterium]|nr:polysaccharide biosynthesis protein [Paracoccaceae bacterium]
MAVDLTSLSRDTKARSMLLLDSFLSAFAIYASIVLRRGSWWPADTMEQAYPYLLLAPVFAFVLSFRLRIPWNMLRTFGVGSLQNLAMLAACVAACLVFLRFGFQMPLPRSVPAIFFVVYLVSIVGARLLILRFMRHEQSRDGTSENVLVYGAGSAGRQLQAGLQGSRRFFPVAFVDDNPALKRVSVGGLRVYASGQMKDVIRNMGVKKIILAMPTITPERQRHILNEIAELPCEILTLPSIEKLLTGQTLKDQLRPVEPNDLLGRQSVQLDLPELTEVYRGKSVLVTGAGGSIGSELCRQVLHAGPSRIVLLEQGEFALYSIEMELQTARENTPEIVAVLGSVCDAALVGQVFREHEIDIVLHAAAYKHVPMVEKNVVEGVKNNVFGTKTVAEQAQLAGVARFILVSTDKAVRPTNVMGASKRFAELVVQDLQAQSSTTVFSMVRFGNVLGSSGSVIPLFQKQISIGGPVTVTHEEVTRYFMTIPEASQLVLLAGSFASGGEVFVLDMGSSVKIIDLARNLIKISGLNVKDANNPNGDIEIKVTGLRPGEKLFEELLIGDNVIGTPHPKIMTAVEIQHSAAETDAFLTKLESAIAASSSSDVVKTLQEAVEGYSGR